MLRAVLDTLWGATLLGWSLVVTGRGPMSPYWRWRWLTAFGRGTPPRPELARGLAHYARWVASMRRLR